MWNQTLCGTFITGKMLKYTDTAITLREIPDEITLCINISNCPCHCKGCHSSYLAEDIGEELTDTRLMELIDNNSGITCVSFMGGDSDPKELIRLVHSYVSFMAWQRPDDEVPAFAWYSGRQELPASIGEDWKWFNYIKLGPYIEELGGLDSRTTNQRLYTTHMCRELKENDEPVYALEDITYKFWKERP